MNQKRQCALSAFLIALILAGFLLGAAPKSLLAQSSDPDTESHHINGRYFGKMGIDFGKVLISPFHWKGKDLLLFGGTVAATGLFMAALDKKAKEYVDKHQTASKQKLSTFITHFGEAPILVGLSAFFYVGGEAFKSDSLRETGLMCLESYAITGVIVTGLKLIAGRHRPLASTGPWEFHLFTTNNSEHALPSGHAASAFSVASVIAGESDSFWVGAASYGAATLVALSRITQDEHWFSDIFLGSVIGYFIGKEVLALNRSSQGSKPTLGLGMAPGGFSLSLRF